jgi:hypothetical protein
LNKLLIKRDEKICQGGVGGEASDDGEGEDLVADMGWAQMENAFAQTVDIVNLINEAFHVMQKNAHVAVH